MEAIRPMLEDRAERQPIRIWVVGCATGEEACSIAILMLEEASRLKVRPAIQIFASDLDEGALATGREGLYPRSIEADVSEERLRRFFVEEGPHYRIRKEVRDLVLFATHSALKDPPLIHLDLVTCRNLLIYLEREVQRQLCALFAYALRPGGYLFLGSAETADTSPELFRTLNREARVYQAKPRARQSAAAAASDAARASSAEFERPRPPRPHPDRGSTAQHVAALEDSSPRVCS